MNERAALLFPGDWPDPSILRVGDDYYCTHSSFGYAPGLQVWHSRDLSRWRPLSYGLPQGHGDVWAPDLVQHGGRFFIYFKTSGGIHVVHADDPGGPWSLPLHLPLPGIDPGHVVGDDGQRYLHLSDGRAVALTADGLGVSGEVQQVYTGWPMPDEPRFEGRSLEGPKLLWRDGWCHLFSAMGGTAGPSTAHAVVHARGRSPLGPFENSPYNPVIRTASREERWHCRGHGTPFEGPDGQWYVIEHAYERGFTTLGRQTLLEPVKWTDDGWLVPDAGAPRPPEGELQLPASDRFTEPTLGPQWRFFGSIEPDRFTVGGSALRLAGRGTTLADSPPLCLIARDHAYAIETDVQLVGDGMAGLTLFYSPEIYVAIAIAPEGIRLAIRGQFQARAVHGERVGQRVGLRIVNDRHEIDFWFRSDPDDPGSPWQKLPKSIDVSGYHHNTFGRFLSLRPGLFAAGEGAATFRSFTYDPQHES